MLVQTLLAKLAVQALYESILGGLASQSNYLIQESNNLAT